VGIVYEFTPGQRVCHRDGRVGEVVTCVPGNGTIPWYFVRWDLPPLDPNVHQDVVEEGCTGDELTAY
jgi:hypothetical protein